MTPRAPGKERVEELRRRVCWGNLNDAAVTDLLAILDEHEQLKDDLLDAQGDAASNGAQADSFAKIVNELTASKSRGRLSRP